MAETLTYELPDTTRVAEAEGVLTLAKSIVIDSTETYEIALNELSDVNDQIKAITEERMKIARPLDAAKKAVMELFARLTLPREQAAGQLRVEIKRWRKSEADRVAREQAQIDAAARRERERLEAEAKKLEAAGKPEEAAAAASIAAVVMAPRVAPATPKVAGASFPKTWHGVVDNPAAFLAHIAAHPEFMECIEFKQAKLDALARTFKGLMNIPGLRAEEREGIRS